MSNEEMSDEVRVMAAHGGGSMDATHGIQALHGMAPDELVMELEDGGRSERSQIRVESMRLLLLYFFADGSGHRLELVTRRVYAVARGLFPELLSGMDGGVLAGIFDESGDEECARAWERRALVYAERGRKVFWEGVEPFRRGMEFRELLGERHVGREDESGVWGDTMDFLMRFFFVEETPTEWRRVMMRVYVVAKSLFPELIMGMSLENLGEVFGEENTRAARARWSARAKVIVAKFLRESGAVAHAKYQKSASTCRKYAQAQLGNQNRKSKK